MLRAVELCGLLCVFFLAVNTYEVPEATIEILHPKGFTVSIPDEPGIRLFAFHAKINEEMNGREGGTFSRDIVVTRNGRWTFADKNTRFKVGDVIYYWTYVDYFDGERTLGYTRDDQQFVVQEVGSVIKPTNVTSSGARPSPGESPNALETTETKKLTNRQLERLVLLEHLSLLRLQKEEILRRRTCNVDQN